MKFLVLQLRVYPPSVQVLGNVLLLVADTIQLLCCAGGLLGQQRSFRHYFLEWPLTGFLSCET